MIESHEKAIAVDSSDRQTNKLSKHHSSNSNRITPHQLLETLELLPTDWAFVAVGENKAPIGNNWQNTPLTKQDIEEAVQSGCFKCLSVKKDNGIFHPPISWFLAVGVLCGTLSGGLLFFDHDGASCDQLIQQLSGQSLEEALPQTVSVTSGREGRYQSIYRVPERYWGAISTQKLQTGTNGEDGKPDLLEFRWDGCQSVVIGYHPITGAYKWLPACSPTECSVAEAPIWMIEQMLENKHINQPSQPKLQYRSPLQNWTKKDWALSYLHAIPSTEDYETWIKVGMALHSISNDLLEHWDCWSRTATNYEVGGCANKWKSFKEGSGLGIGTLGLLAKQNGWRSPFLANSDRSIRVPVEADGNDRQNLSPAEELEDIEDTEELAEEVQSLVKLTEEVAPVQSLLLPRLTIPLTHLAKQFNVPLEALIGVLLPVAASLLRVETCIEIDANTGFRPPAILWAGLVGESGATKSPIFNSLLSPLERLQADADASFQLAFAVYKEELDSWKEQPKDKRGDIPTQPIQREYYLQDATMEAIADCLSKQPNRGIIVAVDELAGFFAGFNQYRAKGRGNDRQKWLSVYDGKAIKINRKTGYRVSVPRTAVSITGTIQPCALRKQMEDLEEVDGFWARFIWIPLPLTAMPPPEEGANFNLSGLLQAIYKNLEKLPSQTYQLDRKGRQIWKRWHCFCEEQKVSEPNSALRAVYPKAKERAARIALVAHCINAIIEERTPEPIVSSEILEAAIAFTKWSIGQTRLIYADSGITTHPDSSKITRFIERFKGKGWISARQVTHWSPKKPKANAARAFMKKVVDLGYAIDNGKAGKDYRICIKDNSGNAGNNAPISLAGESVRASNSLANQMVTNSPGA